MNINIPPFLEAAFEKGFSFTDSENTVYDFYCSPLGEIKIINGNIIACDPFLYNNDLPFNTTFPTGSFPVELAIAKMNADERVGLARIKFSAAMPTSWTMAVCEGQDVSSLSADDFYGYGVDAGTGAFMDTAGGDELMKYLMTEYNNYEIIAAEMDKNYQDTWSWLMWESNDTNVAMFSSGWGDGVYATYIGYDENNSICRLVTDFGVIY